MNQLSPPSSASLGVPAHFTVLYPFLSLEQINASVLATLTALFQGVEAFPVELSETAWFGIEVLWLAPVDPEPIRTLTALVHEAFPDFPPFEGKFADTIPHLTIANGHDRARMTAAEQAVERHLPINAQAEKVTLMAQAEHAGKWTTKAHFHLCRTP
ncbi:MAG: 2'-5' RNA ligase family protein [Dermatophilaceae bacterium]|nr:2'-5' RNA ligase family protein [Dermatophilaceae bacterium]